MDDSGVAIIVVQLLLTLLVSGLLALIPANIAKSKGRRFGLWWLYGWFLFTVALIHALLLKPDQDYEDAVRLQQGGKKCPFCAEVIREEAVVCRFCGRDVPATASASTTPEPYPCAVCGAEVPVGGVCPNRTMGACHVCGAPVSEERAVCERCVQKHLRTGTFR